MAPTISAVAEIAQVSTATVSRVLNGSNARPENRRRVLDAVEQVGYRPNRVARRLRRQQAETIGVLVPDIENPHFNAAVRIFEDAAYRAGYRVLLCNTDETPAKQEAYVRTLAEERVLGVIVASADTKGTGLKALVELGIPLVAFDRLIADEYGDSVVCENVDATRRATEHLIWLGHRRLAFIGGRSATDTGAERLAGYTAAMRAAGLNPFSVNGEFRIEAAEAEVVALMSVAEPPTALVVANNLMVLGALRALRRQGLSVPTDVALVSVDDPPWAALIDPPLTVVAQPVQRMAETAISLLLTSVEQRRTDVAHIVLPVELRIRQSCGMHRGDARAGIA